MIPGVTIAMGGRDWLIPPLTLGQLRRLMPKVRQLTEIGASMGEAQIGVLVEIVAAAAAAQLSRCNGRHGREPARSWQCQCCAECGSYRLGLKSRESRVGEARPPGPARGQTQRTRGQLRTRSRECRRLGTHLWPPRHRLRLQLPRNRRDDALRFRRAHGVLGRASAGPHPGRRVSRRRQTSAPADTLAPSQPAQRGGPGSPSGPRRARARVWRRGRSCRTAAAGARFR